MRRSGSLININPSAATHKGPLSRSAVKRLFSGERRTARMYFEVATV